MTEREREELEFALMLAWHKANPHASLSEHDKAAMRVEALLRREEKNLEMVQARL